MKITFLGTGTSQGIPVIGCQCNICKSVTTKDKRLRASILIETHDKVMVIDSGPDFRQQMLREDVCKLDAILFTHQHKDHIAGLDDIRAYNYFTQKPMDVYADKFVQEALMREYSYIFADFKYPGIPEVNLHLIENQPFKSCGVDVIPIQVMHLNLPVFGFRIGDFTYITDANYISSQEKVKIVNSKVLVINALRKKNHISHFTLSQALDIIMELQPEKAYLTHMSHQMGLHEDVQKELPEHVFLAYDGLKLEI